MQLTILHANTGTCTTNTQHQQQPTRVRAPHLSLSTTTRTRKHTESKLKCKTQHTPKRVCSSASRCALGCVRVLNGFVRVLTGVVRVYAIASACVCLDESVRARASMFEHSLPRIVPPTCVRHVHVSVSVCDVSVS